MLHSRLQAAVAALASVVVALVAVVAVGAAAVGKSHLVQRA